LIIITITTLRQTQYAPKDCEHAAYEVDTKHGETLQNQHQLPTKYSWQVKPLIETMSTDSKEVLEHGADLKSVPWLLTNHHKQQSVFVFHRLLDLIRSDGMRVITSTESVEAWSNIKSIFVIFFYL
jgi:hypothetical protein